MILRKVYSCLLLHVVSYYLLLNNANAWWPQAPPLWESIGILYGAMSVTPDCQHGAFFALDDGTDAENKFCTTNTAAIIATATAVANAASFAAYTSATASLVAAESATADGELAFNVGYPIALSTGLLALVASAEAAQSEFRVCDGGDSMVTPMAYTDAQIKYILGQMGINPTVENIVDKYTKICVQSINDGSYKWMSYGDCWYKNGVNVCAYGPENTDPSIVLCARISSTCPCAMAIGKGLIDGPTYNTDSNGVIKTNSNGTLEIKDDGTYYHRSASYYTSHAGIHCKALRQINRPPITPSYNGIVDDICSSWSGYSKNRVTLSAGAVQCVVHTMRNLFEKPLITSNVPTVLKPAQQTLYNNYSNDYTYVQNAITLVTSIENSTQSNTSSINQLANEITAINNGSAFSAGPYNTKITALADAPMVALQTEITQANQNIANTQSQMSTLQNNINSTTATIDSLNTQLNSFSYGQLIQQDQALINACSSFANTPSVAIMNGTSSGSWWPYFSDTSVPNNANLGVPSTVSYYVYLSSLDSSGNYLIYYYADDAISVSINNAFMGQTSCCGLAPLTIGNGTLTAGMNLITISVTNTICCGYGATLALRDPKGNNIFSPSVTNTSSSTLFSGCNNNPNPSDSYCSSNCYTNYISKTSSPNNFGTAFNNTLAEIALFNQEINTLNSSLASNKATLQQYQNQYATLQQTLSSQQATLASLQAQIPSDVQSMYSNLNQILSDLNALLSEIDQDRSSYMGHALQTDVAKYTAFQSLQGSLAGLIFVVLILYFVIIGFKMINGQFSLDISAIAPIFVDFALVYYFAIGTAWKDFVLNVVINVANGFAAFAMEIPLSTLNMVDGCNFNQNYYIPSSSSALCDFPPNTPQKTVTYDQNKNPVQGCMRGPYIPMPQYDQIYKPVMYSTMNSNGTIESVWLPVYCYNSKDSTQTVQANLIADPYTNGMYQNLTCPEGYIMEDGYRASALNAMGLISTELVTTDNKYNIMHTAIEIVGPGGAVTDIVNTIANQTILVLTASLKYQHKTLIESIRAAANRLERNYPIIQPYGATGPTIDMSYVGLFDTLDCKAMSYFGYTPDNTEDVIYTKLMGGMMTSFPFGWIVVALMIVMGISLISMLGNLVQKYIVCFSGLMILFFMSPIVFTCKLFPDTSGYFDEWMKKVTGFLATIPLTFFMIGITLVLFDYAMYGSPAIYNPVNPDGTTNVNYIKVFNSDGTVNSGCATNSNLSTAPLVCLAYYFVNNINWIGVPLTHISLPQPHFDGVAFLYIFKTLAVALAIAFGTTALIDMLNKIFESAGIGADSSLNGSIFNTNSALSGNIGAGAKAAASALVDIPRDISKQASHTSQQIKSSENNSAANTIIQSKPNNMPKK